jgi:hypothetical protein
MTTTLTNPTDDQLNCAFAEKVAGWTQDKEEYWHDAEGSGVNEDGFYLVPSFTTSADAVLPWLEKWTQDHPGDEWHVGQRKGMWAIDVHQPKGFIDQYNSRDKSLAKAAVIALLRAHGVVVEFTTPV